MRNQKTPQKELPSAQSMEEDGMSNRSSVPKDIGEGAGVTMVPAAPVSMETPAAVRSKAPSDPDTSRDRLLADTGVTTTPGSAKKSDRKVTTPGSKTPSKRPRSRIAAKFGTPS